MKRILSRKLRFWLWAALFGGYSVAVAGVVVDAIGENYQRLSAVKDTTVRDPLAQRQLGATQIAALYRARSATPFLSLPTGDTFRVVWPDGSTELVRVVSQSSAQGVVPVEGSQVEAAPAELQVVPVSPVRPASEAATDR